MLRPLFIVSLVAGLAAGCQCCQVTEWYQDGIDCVADCKAQLDHLYHPQWDVSRIGQPDWCQGRLNRRLWPHCCEKCRPLPSPYAIVVESPLHPVPAEPAVEPALEPEYSPMPLDQEPHLPPMPAPPFPEPDDRRPDAFPAPQLLQPIEPVPLPMPKAAPDPAASRSDSSFESAIRQLSAVESRPVDEPAAEKFEPPLTEPPLTEPPTPIELPKGVITAPASVLPSPGWVGRTRKPEPGNPSR